jgi:hypothetical protein
LGARVNNYGDFGRRAFMEIEDPGDAESTIRTNIEKGTGP